MALSNDEQRDLGEIGRILARDKELCAVASLFAEPQHVKFQAERKRTPSHGSRLGTVGALLAAVVSFVTGCVVASTDGPGQITAGTLLVLCSAAMLVAVLVRHRARLCPGLTGG